MTNKVSVDLDRLAVGIQARVCEEMATAHGGPGVKPYAYLMRSIADHHNAPCGLYVDTQTVPDQPIPEGMEPSLPDTPPVKKDTADS